VTRLVVGLLALAYPVRHPAAQEPVPPAVRHPVAAPVSRGETVRVRSALLGRAPVIGRLTAVRADTLLLTLEGGASLALPRGSLTRVEARRERQSAMRNGAIGAAAGALAGLLGYMRWCDRNPAPCRAERDSVLAAPDSEFVLTTDLVFIGGGAILGGLLGRYLTPRRWQPVVVPEWLGRAPDRRGGWSVRVGVAVAVR
jgi:hypothetical protein